jgi:hypothetical protein
MVRTEHIWRCCGDFVGVILIYGQPTSGHYDRDGGQNAYMAEAVLRFYSDSWEASRATRSYADG